MPEDGAGGARGRGGDVGPSRPLPGQPRAALPAHRGLRPAFGGPLPLTAVSPVVVTCVADAKSAHEAAKRARLRHAVWLLRDERTAPRQMGKPRSECGVRVCACVRVCRCACVCARTRVCMYV